jgi:hypothetical protein
MRAIEISLNGLYLSTTTQHRTCRAAVARVREIAKHRPVIVAGRGPVIIHETDKVTALFKPDTYRTVTAW